MSHISEHPEFVLRSRYVQLRALFAIAAIAALCLTAAVVILALDDDGTSSAPLVTAPAATSAVPYDTVSVSGVRYDGGPDEGTRGMHAVLPAADTRYDGGPNEGTRGLHTASPPADTRYDGGPNEGTRGPGR